MKAILVRYLPQTNKLPARLKATAYGAKPVVISWDAESRFYETGGNRYADAALMLASRMGWAGDMLSGGMPDGTSEVFVFDHPASDRYCI